MIVLLSGGLDSTVNCYRANSEGQIQLVLTFDYGQRAAKREIESAKKTCKKLDLKHQVIELPWLKEITQTALVNRDSDVPVSFDINDGELIFETARSVWVPNRNGVFINIAGCFADSLKADKIVVGFNAEEAVTFPDNSEEYLAAVTKSLFYSTEIRVKTICYTTDLFKNEIVALGKDLEVSFDDIWPCYFGENEPCGKCESCMRYRAAMEMEG